MSRVAYDNFKIVIKKREDECIIAFVEYYKNNRLIDKKRTTNITYILKLLKTASSTIKEAKYVEKNLVSNYQSNGMIVIENYDSIKNEIEFKEFNKKIEKKLSKKGKMVTKEKENKTVETNLLAGVKNLKVTTNKELLKKVKLKAKKLIPTVALSALIMSQVLPIIKHMPSFNLFIKEIETGSQDDLITQVKDTMTVDQTTVTLPENSDSGQTNAYQANAVVKEQPQVEVSISNQVLDYATQTSNLNTEELVQEPITQENYSNFEQQEVQTIDSSNNEELTSVIETGTEQPICTEPIENSINPAITEEISSSLENNEVSLSTVIEPTQDEAIVEPKTNENTVNEEKNIEDNENNEQSSLSGTETSLDLDNSSASSSSLEENNNIQQETVDNEASNISEPVLPAMEPISVSTSSESNVQLPVEFSEIEITSNEAEPETINGTQTSETTDQTSVETIIDEACAKYNLTEEQFDTICAIVQQEAGHNPEEVKNVMTTVLNRMESGKWGGTTPWEVMTASGQFEAYGKGRYKEYTNNNYDETTPYIVGSMLTGQMEPTHNWERFNSNTSTSYGGTILTPGGNRYK